MQGPQGEDGLSAYEVAVKNGYKGTQAQWLKSLVGRSGGGGIGIAGIKGDSGTAGATGATGAGVVSGGTTGQVLTKASNTDYDTQWASDISLTGVITGKGVNIGTGYGFIAGSNLGIYNGTYDGVTALTSYAQIGIGSMIVTEQSLSSGIKTFFNAINTYALSSMTSYGLQMQFSQYVWDETTSAAASPDTLGTIRYETQSDWTTSIGTHNANMIIGINAAGTVRDMLSVKSDGTVVIGDGSTFGAPSGKDFALVFDGQSNDGVVTWMEDEDYFKFSDDIFMDSTEGIYFRDTALSIFSQADGYLNIVSDTGTRLGDATPTNYTQFDSTGHQAMFGTARPWRDELTDALSLQESGVGVSRNAAEGTVDFAYNSVYTASFTNCDAMYCNMQLNHDKDLTASVKCNSLAFTYTSGTTHQISYSDPIAVPVGTTLSDIVQFRVYRDTTNESGLFTGACPYNTSANATVGVMAFDVHFMINSLGSTDELTK